MAQKCIIGPDGEQTYVDLTPEEEAERASEAQQAVAKAAEEASAVSRLNTIKEDAGFIDLIDRLRTATPAQWQTYLDNNLTNLASAKTVIYRMGLALMLLARQIG